MHIPNTSLKYSHETATLIDNLYVIGKSIVNLHGILVADISDHFPLLVFIGNSSKKHKNTTIFEYRKLDTMSTDRINTLLLSTDWSPLALLHVNEQFDFVKNKLQILIYVPQ